MINTHALGSEVGFKSVEECCFPKPFEREFLLMECLREVQNENFSTWCWNVNDDCQKFCPTDFIFSFNCIDACGHVELQKK